MADKAEKRYGKPNASKMQNKEEKGAERKAEATAGGEKKNSPEMMKTADKPKAVDEASVGGAGAMAEVHARHFAERREMNTRHEREHKEMSNRHMRELGGTLTQADIVGTSPGLGGPGGEG